MRSATLDDLRHTEGQAELIAGRILCFPPAGHQSACVAGRICRSLFEHVDASGVGEVFTATAGYVIPALDSGRESFCSDAYYYSGPPPTNRMDFIQGAPTLAVEVRSENDYGPAAEQEIAAKRRDYFEAGTEVVWDVDPIAGVIHVYRHSDPTNPITYGRGQEAEAELAVPDWRVSVDWIFA